MSEHAEAVRERERAIAQAQAAVVKARESVILARQAVEPLLRKLREAEAAARQAENEQELAVSRGNAAVRKSLSDDECFAIHCWSLDVQAEHEEERNKPLGMNSPIPPRRKNRIAELQRAAQSVKELEMAEDPVAEIAALRAKLRVPALKWVRDQPGDPKDEPPARERTESELALAEAFG